MTAAQRVALLLRSQYHAISATALHEQVLGNAETAEELREAAEYLDLLADAIDGDLFFELEKRRMTRKLFEVNGIHIDFSNYGEAQLAGRACSSCGAELKDGEIIETTILGPVGRMSRHRRWQDCDVEVPF